MLDMQVELKVKNFEGLFLIFVGFDVVKMLYFFFFIVFEVVLFVFVNRVGLRGVVIVFFDFLLEVLCEVDQLFFLVLLKVFFVGCIDSFVL